jgi:hypothetical protein
VRKRDTGQGEGRMGRAARERDKEEGEASRCSSRVPPRRPEWQVGGVNAIGQEHATQQLEVEDRTNFQKTPWLWKVFQENTK